MGSRGVDPKLFLSNRLKMSTTQPEEWKNSLCFTGDNPTFPVEMFIRIIEEESDKQGFDDNEKVLEVLSRVPDYRPSAKEPNTDYEPAVEPPASAWKRKLLDRQRTMQGEDSLSNSDEHSGTGGFNWEELKSDMISELGRKPNHSYTTFEKLNLLQSLCKGKKETCSTFLIRVLTVVSILENDRPINGNCPIDSNATVNFTDQSGNEQYSSPDNHRIQKESIWVRMLLLLGLSRRERIHLLQLGNEIENKSNIDICSYLTTQKDLHIKQEVLSSSDEDKSDQNDKEKREVSKATEQNYGLTEEDNLNYQHHLDLEMEVGLSRPPAIKVSYLALNQIHFNSLIIYNYIYFEFVDLK